MADDKLDLLVEGTYLQQGHKRRAENPVLGQIVLKESLTQSIDLLFIGEVQ